MMHGIVDVRTRMSEQEIARRTAAALLHEAAERVRAEEAEDCATVRRSRFRAIRGGRAVVVTLGLAAGSQLREHGRWVVAASAAVVAIAGLTLRPPDRGDQPLLAAPTHTAPQVPESTPAPPPRSPRRTASLSTAAPLPSAEVAPAQETMVQGKALPAESEMALPTASPPGVTATATSTPPPAGTPATPPANSTGTPAPTTASPPGDQPGGGEPTTAPTTSTPAPTALPDPPSGICIRLPLIRICLTAAERTPR